jgi:predicted nucleotidyltransferase
MILDNLSEQDLKSCPKWLPDNCHYLTIMGSYAYGVNTEDSDFDVYGFCIPPKNMIFPHLDGEIVGFGRQKKKFEQWHMPHLKVKEQEYDFTVYSIVKYFSLCMENNPNMIDSLYTPHNLVIFSTKIGDMVRENRDLFLHKGVYHKLKGYAYSQLHLMKTKNPQEGSKRYDNIQEYGYDTKYAYHVIRLIDECEQILETHTLDLQRNNEQLKAIRKGEIKEEEIRKIFAEKEIYLAKLYETSTLRYSPDEDAIKSLLLKCLESHYGSLDKCLVINNEREKLQKAIRTLSEINEMLEELEKYSYMKE